MLSLFGAALLPGCLAQRTGPSTALPVAPLILGWRWVPGASFTFRTRIERTNAGVLTQRTEQWTYLVTGLTGTTATLVGHLTGFGAGRSRGDLVQDVSRAAASERERLATPVTLMLGADGRLTYCSAPGFSDSLVHRLLALRLPPSAVRRNAEWPAPDLAEPFAALMAPDLDLTRTARSRLSEINQRDGVALAIIETQGAVTAEGGLTVHLDGTSAWDLRVGALSSRQLTARFTPSGPTPADNPGRIDLATTRVG